MVHLPEIAKLNITELNLDTIDSVIEAIKRSPDELFDDISKTEMVEMYKLAKELMKDLVPNYFI